MKKTALEKIKELVIKHAPTKYPKLYKTWHKLSSEAQVASDIEKKIEAEEPKHGSESWGDWFEKYKSALHNHTDFTISAGRAFDECVLALLKHGNIK